MAEQLYTLKNGKYIPYNDPYALDGLTNGSWLVIVNGNSTSIRKVIEPKFLELEASLKYLEEGLCSAMLDSAKLRPRSTPISKKEQKAWAAFQKIMGKDHPVYFEFASLHEIAQKGCEYLRKVMVENKCNIKKIEKKYRKVIVKDEPDNSILYLSLG